MLDDEKHPEKRQKANQVLRSVVNKDIITSTQVINEVYCTLLKYNISERLIQEKISLILAKYNLVLINIETLKACWKIRIDYKYSYWDSLILASALESNCIEVLSEDMQHNQVIEDKIKIINPLF